MKQKCNKFYPSIFLSSLMFLILACGTRSSNKQPQSSNTEVNHPFFQKMVGLWQNIRTGDFERWVANDNGTFRFDGFTVKGTDTTWIERGNVYQQNGQWVSENTVVGQNDGKSVIFTAGVQTDNRVVFSNADHDFPTDISYTMNDANNVSAFICGPNDRNGKDTLYFQYKRIQ